MNVVRVFPPTFRWILYNLIMLTYNTRLKPLAIPEYGRNIQQMVDHCLTIDDKDERTRCAYSIVNSMAKLFPKIKEDEDYRRKLWDHLMIMSRFQLDVDFPFEVINEESLHTKPERVPYTNSFIRFRHYGKEIEHLILKASEMEPGEERDELTLMIANHMKKQMAATNVDGVDDTRIFRDLEEMSHGALRLSQDTTKLFDYKIVTPPASKKKKKKN